MKNYSQEYQGKVVAITGSSGYLGSVIVEQLKKTSAQILCVSQKPIESIEGTETFVTDIRTESCWNEIVLKSDIIFHLSANTSIYSIDQDMVGSFDSSVKPITHLLGAARKHGKCPTIVFASTATVYGMTNKLPVTESSKLSPITVYDLHKLFVEKQLEFAANKNIINAVSLRLANIYGPSPSISAAFERGILNKVIGMALKEKKIYVFGAGDYIRDYVYVDDVAKAFILGGIEEKMHGETLNVASGIGISIFDAFNRIKERVAAKLGYDIAIENTAWPKNTDPIETRNFIADISRISSFGWAPEINLDTGIDRMIDNLCSGN